MKVRFLDAAIDDLQTAEQWYEAEEPGFSEELMDEVEQKLSQIRELPLAGKKIGKRFRSIQLSRFPYSLIYFVRE